MYDERDVERRRWPGRVVRATGVAVVLVLAACSSDDSDARPREASAEVQTGKETPVEAAAALAQRGKAAMEAKGVEVQHPGEQDTMNYYTFTDSQTGKTTEVTIEVFNAGQEPDPGNLFRVSVLELIPDADGNQTERSVEFLPEEIGQPEEPWVVAFSDDGIYQSYGGQADPLLTQAKLDELVGKANDIIAGIN